MGLGKMLMEQLYIKNHVGYCNHCGTWTAFTKRISNAFTCPECGNFGSPGYNTKR
jgi:predicted RNA-binding Zn-ribbon protein involved in translation (DUF1610 family)